MARLHAEASEIAQQLASGPQAALRSIKRLLRRAADGSFREAIAAENAAQTVPLVSDDFRDGVRSFVEERPPEFTGG